MKVQLQGRKAITAEDFHNAYLTRQGELTCVHNGLQTDELFEPYT